MHIYEKLKNYFSVGHHERIFHTCYDSLLKFLFVVAFYKKNFIK